MGIGLPCPRPACFHIRASTSDLQLVQMSKTDWWDASANLVNAFLWSQLLLAIGFLLQYGTLSVCLQVMAS